MILKFIVRNVYFVFALLLAPNSDNPWSFLGALLRVRTPREDAVTQGAGPHQASRRLELGLAPPEPPDVRVWTGGSCGRWLALGWKLRKRL